MNFVMGNVGTGKSKYCMDKIKENISKYENILYIVPEQYTLEMQKGIIKYLDINGIINVEVLSFERLVYRVFEELGIRNNDFLDEVTKNIIITKIVNENIEKLNYRCVNEIDYNVISEYVNTIEEFLRYDVSDINIDNIEEKLLEDENLKSKLDDLKVIYKEYINYVKNRYSISEVNLDLLVSIINKSNIIKNSLVFIDEFYGFSIHQLKVIKSMLNLVDDIYITIPIEEKKIKIDDSNKYTWKKSIQNMFNELIQLVNETGSKYNIISLDNSLRHKNNKELLFLGNEYFNYPTKRYLNKVDNITINVTNTIEDEMELVCRNIYNDIRENSNNRYNNFAIIVCDYESNIKLVQKKLELYNIPYYLDYKISMDTYNLSRLVLSIYDVIIYNFSFNSIMTYLKTGYSNINKDEIDLIENYILKHGIKGFKIWSNSEWKYSYINIKSNKDKELSDYNNLKVNQINNIRETILIPFKNLKNKVSKSKENTVYEYTKFLYEFLEDMNIYDILESKIKECVKTELDLKQLWNNIIMILDKMVLILDDTKFTINEYMQILKVAFSTNNIAKIPIKKDKVVIGDIHRSRLHEIDKLYIIGANDGKLPSVVKKIGIFTDEERNYLEKIEIGLVKESKQRLYQQEFEIYNLLLKPKKELVISYSDKNLEGKNLKKSIVVNRIMSIFSNIKINRISLNDDLFNIYTDKVEREKIFKLLVKNNKTVEELTYINNIIEYYKRQKIDYKDDIYDYYNNQPLNLSRNIIDELYKKHINISSTTLQDYVMCPFLFYIKNVLRVSKRDEFELKNLDIGNLYHDVVKNVFEKIIKEKIDINEVENDIILKLAKQVFEEYIELSDKRVFKYSNKNIFIVNNLKNIFISSINMMIKHLRGSKFKPAYFEVGFNNNECFKPLKIDVLDKQILFSGRIDRIDTYTENNKIYIKIIDYKSGNNKFDFSDLYNKLNMQIVLYMTAIINNKDNFKDKSITPAGMFYFNINDKKISIDTKLKEELIDKKISREYKMSGLVLKDIDIIKEMDIELEKKSDIIPVDFTKDGNYSKNSNVLSEGEFKKVNEYVIEKVEGIGKQIIEGNIKAQPIKDDTKCACDYCIYKSVCNFDVQIPNNKYNKLHKISKDEFMEVLKFKKEK